MSEQRLRVESGPPQQMISDADARPHRRPARTGPAGPSRSRRPPHRSRRRRARSRARRSPTPRPPPGRRRQQAAAQVDDKSTQVGQQIGSQAEALDGVAGELRKQGKDGAGEGRRAGGREGQGRRRLPRAGRRREARRDRAAGRAGQPRRRRSRRRGGGLRRRDGSSRPRSTTTTPRTAPARPRPIAPVPTRSAGNRRTLMAAPASAFDWEGQTVLDRRGEKIGTIEEIFLVEETNRPEWALVKIGRLKGHTTLVPLTRARAVAKGVEVDVGKDVVGEAPAVDADGRAQRSAGQRALPPLRHRGRDRRQSEPRMASRTDRAACERQLDLPGAAARSTFATRRSATCSTPSRRRARPSSARSSSSPRPR